MREKGPVIKKQMTSSHVLLIDDEPYIIELLASEMKDREIKFLCATDGNAAFKLIEQEKPAVIVTDHKMPGLSGMELLRFLRNLKINVPMIWITGNADEETMRQAWMFGVYNIFQKPFNPEVVADEISNALAIGQDAWLHMQPKFITETLLDKYIQRIQLEIDKDLYQAVKERCLENAVSLNIFINNLLREAVK